jgi:hypothetical protein
MEGACCSITCQINSDYCGISKRHGEKDDQRASGLAEQWPYD